MNQLHYACRRGDLRKVTTLLFNIECDINAYNTDGESPLHVACKYGHLEIVKVLHKGQKCNLNIQNSYGDTPLHIACGRKSLCIIRFLLEKKCSTNIPNIKGETAQDIPLNEDGDRLLNIACQWGDVNVVEYLITNERCNPNVQNAFKNTPLHIAVKFGQEDIIVQLLSCQECNPNVQNKEGDTPLHIAVKEDLYELIDSVDVENKTLAILLAHQQCDPNLSNKVGDAPLHIAADCGQTDTVARLLLNKKCSPNVQNSVGNTPLHIAVEHNMMSITSQLLAHQQCNMKIQNREGDTPLHIAVRVEFYPFVELLLKQKCISDGRCNPDVQNDDLNTPMHIACYKKSLKIIIVLFEMRCSTNIPNKKGQTAQDIPLNEDGDYLLHIACQWGDVDIVKYLINDERCNPNIQNAFKNTPLHIAVKFGQEDIIVQLLSCQECNPNVQNKEGDTPLHIAVNEDLYENIDSVDVENKTLAILLAHQQCDPNLSNKVGDAPLHIAADCGQTDTVARLLLNKKCSPNVQNSVGNTPLHIAVKQNMTSITSQLLAHQQCNMKIQNREGDTPLHIAVRVEFYPFVELLLKQKCISDGRCNPDVQNDDLNTPLHIACYKKSLKIIIVLLEMRCRTNIPNKKGQTVQDIPLNEDGDYLLHIACQWGDVDIVKYLITDERCTTESLNYSLNTPLHIACYKKSLKVIIVLLEMKCSTNIPNKKGVTAQDIPLNEDGDCLLHIACQWGDVDIVRYLITDERCNPNVQNAFKNTPLHIAVKFGQEDIIVQLLSCQECNPNVQNKEGDTPLHIAVKEDLYENIDSVDVENKTLAILLAHQQCDPNLSNKVGDAPLHIAANCGQTDTVARLLLNKKCSPNVQNSVGNTPLHIAVKQNMTSITSQLLAHQQCNVKIQNREGDTPLHVAVRVEFYPFVELLLKQKCISDGRCNPDVQNDDLNTPMHIACYKKSLKIIIVLLEMRCSTNIPNKKGQTVQDIPLNEDGDYLLHIACQWGDVDIVKYLINDERCNPNIQNAFKNTPLHIAVKEDLYENIDSVDVENKTLAILLAHQQCDPNLSNKVGDAPLHIAADCGQTDTVARLLLNKKCSPNVQNSVGNTPLHIAVEHNMKAVFSQLVDHKQCNVNAQNMKDDTPLHIAVKGNITPAISQLLKNEHCNPNVQDMDRLTPLLTAIKQNNNIVATTLLQHSKCDRTVRDAHGNTPLHLACISGETHPEMVKVAKQLLTSVDPSCVNNAGQTPIELTTNYQLIQTISRFVKCKTNQSVQTYINMFIVGNPETGKSTLIQAILKEATGILWKIVPKQVRRVKNVPLHTAGIIPTTFRSKKFGNTVLYDLAGQVEYYTSHAAVIRSTVISTPPAFIVVVNLSESDEKISQTLRYWWSFIDNHAAQTSAPPEVILVGSHADVVASTGGSVQERMAHMSDLLKQLQASFHFAGLVALDCRDPASRKLQRFCSLVEQRCTELRQTADVDLRCHVLYALLLERFKGKVACTVSDVATSVKETSEHLPQNPTHLIPLILTLSDKGLLLLVKGGERHGDWWIILQKQVLLGELNGAIFAPKGFKQHKEFFWSTGVVPFMKLKNEFSDYDPNMVSEFLIHLEFCFKIEDRQTLALLEDEATNVEDTSPDVSEEYYFFPALVSVENPLHIWEQNDDMCCKCGWFYQCIRPDQFLTTQFLHVLILHLAFTFALKLNPGDSRHDSFSLRRRCSVWKHGIAWLNGVPIETVIEVGLQHQSVIVMMRCPTGKEAKCVQLRSEVIQKVLEAKAKHCKAVKMSESFIHPNNVKYPFMDNIEDVNYYSLPEIARMIIEGEANVLDQKGRNPVSLQELLLFDRHNAEIGSELLSELFSEKHSVDEPVRTQVLEILKCKYNESCTFGRASLIAGLKHGMERWNGKWNGTRNVHSCSLLM